MLKPIIPRDVSAVSRSFLARAFDQKLSVMTTQRKKLEGKVVLITGAASGIGKETAAKFITHGAKVVIADIQEQAGRDAAAELGENPAFVACDVSNESHVSAAVDLAVSLHGRLDIMYNNAGIPCRTPLSVVDLDMADFDRVMWVNARGVVEGIKHATRVMIPRRSGCILCTGSVTGVLGGWPSTPTASRSPRWSES
ncbi:unnamed protein product [Cuscuta campestris]|uniref:Uncharacterized protein n=1 Tax=Cuscuta campestris TaxID=132261 RepID=A0A484LMA7_9ASTE|nr:unnamed protein product [Cuscuta campestris]